MQSKNGLAEDDGYGQLYDISALATQIWVVSYVGTSID